MVMLDAERAAVDDAPVSAPPAVGGATRATDRDRDRERQTDRDRNRKSA